MINKENPPNHVNVTRRGIYCFIASLFSSTLSIFGHPKMSYPIICLYPPMSTVTFH